MLIFKLALTSQNMYKYINAYIIIIIIEFKLMKLFNLTNGQIVMSQNEWSKTSPYN
jgi:hypothetical protein